MLFSHFFHRIYKYNLLTRATASQPFRLSRKIKWPNRPTKYSRILPMSNEIGQLKCIQSNNWLCSAGLRYFLEYCHKWYIFHLHGLQCLFQFISIGVISKAANTGHDCALNWCPWYHTSLFTVTHSRILTNLQNTKYDTFKMLWMNLLSSLTDDASGE